jgi:hypothetical protein
MKIILKKRGYISLLEICVTLLLRVVCYNTMDNAMQERVALNERKRRIEYENKKNRCRIDDLACAVINGGSTCRRRAKQGGAIS